MASYIFVLGERHSLLVGVMDEALEAAKNSKEIANIETLKLADEITGVFSRNRAVNKLKLIMSVHEYMRRSQAYSDLDLFGDNFCFVITTFRCSDGDFLTRPSTVFRLSEGEDYSIGGGERMYMEFANRFHAVMPLYERDGYAEDSIFQDLVRHVRR